MSSWVMNRPDQAERQISLPTREFCRRLATLARGQQRWCKPERAARSSHSARFMAWFRVASNHLRYRGHLSRAPYAAWAKTSEGATAIDARVAQYRLYIFRRSRARRRMWRELELAARSQSLRNAIQSEADQFATMIVEASHAPGLPRRTIAFHRLVIVPRTLIAARARTGIRRRLFKSDALGAVDPRVRDFFCEQLVTELDAAVAESRPSAFRPVLTPDGWGCVGRDTHYQWVDPMFSGPDWGGHLLMFEFPREGLSRKATKEVDRAVQELQNSLKNISHTQRDAILRMAIDGLPQLTA